MEEFDDPIQIELETSREVAVLMFCLGTGAIVQMDRGQTAGAQAATNLQVRLAEDDTSKVIDSLNEYGDGGMMSTEGEVSSEAGIARLLDDGEKDPDEVLKGGL